jgi:hypothetical protein
MLNWIALLAGMSAKAYDDLQDNYKLKAFKSETLMEYLKGLHYISLTVISIDDPNFFYIFVIANILHHITNVDGYTNPYEHSLLYSFLLLFFVVQPTMPHMGKMDWLLAVSICTSMWLEPVYSVYLLKDKEYSFFKFISRIGMLIGTIIVFFLSTSKTVQYLICYFIGYSVVSTMVQYYSIKKKKITFYMF